jgi:hypothetical protein
MLGRLCRWLRILGYDAAFFSGAGKADLVYQALKEGRFILTRSHEVSKKQVIGMLVVESDKLAEQIRQVVSSLGLKPEESRFFTRCSFCNKLLIEIGPGTAKGRVPDFVIQTVHSFYECPGCHRVYWKGTHSDMFRSQLETILNHGFS